MKEALRIEANGQTLCVERFGHRDQPAIVLIMGLGTQMLGWPDAFCEKLVAGGYQVIRFDNRDIGLSSKVEGQPTPPLWRLAASATLGLRLRAPYSLEDMATDTVDMMSALNIPSAHIVGASMGGMIAQLIAAHHPERVLTLTCIMSTSGAKRLPGPSLAVSRQMMRRGQQGEEAYIVNAIKTWRLIGSPAYPPSDEALREKLQTSYRRSYYPPGFLRQYAAIIANGDRSPLLKQIKAKTLVIHGDSDALVPLACGRDLAAKIAGAELKIVKGMGHDMPQALWQNFADWINAHLAEKDRQAA